MPLKIKKCSSRIRFRGAVLTAVLSVSCCADNALAAIDTILEHGPSSNRVNTFFLGDGYTASDISTGTYTTHVQNYVDYMFANSVNSDPYYRYRNFFNLYKVNVVSNQSGADVPQSGIVKDTALDATYRYDGVTDRLLYINQTKANTALNNALVGTGKTAQMKFITVNETVYGGGGGSYAVYAGGNSSAREIALHENGHSFSNLADEYGGTTTAYTGSEPGEINVTTSSTGVKWSAWLGYNDPTGGVVGAYNGGRYYDSGIYRPTSNSKMRALGVPFNAIGREKIIKDIYSLVRPLDSYTSNSSTLINPPTIFCTEVDPNVIDTQWFVDGILNATFNNASVIDVNSLGLNVGSHLISLRAYDPTGFDSVNGWVRTNTSLLEQQVAWNVTIVPEPGTVTLLSLIGGILLIRRPQIRRPRRDDKIIMHQQRA